MEEKETVLKRTDRRRNDVNPLLQKNGRKKSPRTLEQKNAYRLTALKILLVILILVLAAALAMECGFVKLPA